jgi:hypothetical protein
VSKKRQFVQRWREALRQFTIHWPRTYKNLQGLAEAKTFQERTNRLYKTIDTTTRTSLKSFSKLWRVPAMRACGIL